MERIFVLIGIIHQLATTRMNRALTELQLPMAQFSLLTHYSHHPEKGWTIGRLAEVMEVNQPAMSKTVQRLVSKGYLTMVQEHADKRIKTVYVTRAGLDILGQAWEKLAPDVMEISSAWKPDEINQLRGLLERLKDQLDEAREK